MAASRRTGDVGGGGLRPVPSPVPSPVPPPVPPTVLPSVLPSVLRGGSLAGLAFALTGEAGGTGEQDLVTAAVERLVRDAPIGFAVLDADLRYVLVNDYLARFAGRSVEEIVGRTVREIVPNVADQAEAPFRGVLETGVPLLELSLVGDVPGDPGVVRHWRESVYPVEVLLGPEAGSEPGSEPGPEGGAAEPVRGLAVLVWEVTDRILAEQAQARAHARLDLLSRASESLSGSLDEDAVLDALVGLVVPALAREAVVLRPDGGRRLRPVRRHLDAASVLDPSADGAGAGAESLARQAFREQRTLVSAGGLSAPMVVRGRTTGVLVLRGDGDALADEVDLVSTLARRAAVALDNARLFGQQSRIAERLQQSLLPQAIPQVPGAGVAVHYATADDAVDVGGDFYDVIRRDERSVVLVIGDVAGRGVDAAGMTGLARHTLRALAHDHDPAAMLARLNDVLVAQDQPDRFLTAACILVELRDDADDADDADAAAFADLTVAGAGHCRPLVVGPDGGGRFLDPTGPLLGVFPHAAIGELRTTLHRGEALVLYTDGITEARSGTDFFGEEGLLAWGAETPDAVARLDADGLVRSLIAAVDVFRGGPAKDDTALLILRPTP